jgi:hypothetical protein
MPRRWVENAGAEPRLISGRWVLKGEGIWADDGPVSVPASPVPAFVNRASGALVDKDGQALPSRAVNLASASGQARNRVLKRMLDTTGVPAANNGTAATVTLEANSPWCRRRSSKADEAEWDEREDVEVDRERSQEYGVDRLYGEP